MDSSQKSMLLCREQPWFELRIKETSFSLQEIQFSRIFSRLLHSSQGLDELLYSSGPYRISTKHSFICQELSILTWLFLGALSNHEISFILCYQTGELVEDAKMWHPPQSLLRANFLKLIFIFGNQRDTKIDIVRISIHWFFTQMPTTRLGHVKVECLELDSGLTCVAAT